MGTAVALTSRAAAESISYWDFPRHGTNLVTTAVDRALLEQAKQKGVKLIRLSPTFWKTPAVDFLLGDADRFRQIRDKDVEELRPRGPFTTCFGKPFRGFGEAVPPPASR